MRGESYHNNYFFIYLLSEKVEIVVIFSPHFGNTFPVVCNIFMQINPIEFSEIEFNWSSENGLSQIWKSKIVKSKLKILENWQFEFNEKRKNWKLTRNL